MTITGHFERFQYFNFETNFLKNIDLFSKIWSTLVESINIDKATFSYKSALSEITIKTNKTGKINWTYHKEWSFAINYFQFPKI